jgi:CRP-like cAMP-binding protein
MATQFARTQSNAAPAPFLLRPVAPSTSENRFAAALGKAVAAEKACVQPRNPGQRIARLLCELGKAYGCRSELPVSRAALASALGISLVRVKRSLALLCLSGVVACDGQRIAVLDWRKLSRAGRFDPAELDLAAEEDDEDVVALRRSEQDEVRFLTASGDPACFV